METEYNKISGTFINVFYDKSKRQKKRIEEILKKPKHDRDKKALKLLLKDNKALRKIFKQYEKMNTNVITCPHCNETFLRVE